MATQTSSADSPSRRAGTVLITGASTGIGAVYADRFAKRGHDLVLVARDRGRMEALAARLRHENGVEIDILPADLGDERQLAAVEARLSGDSRIGILINNAGVSAAGGFLDQSADTVEGVIRINAVALTRLTSSVAPRFAAQGGGSIVNVGSVVGLAPEFGLSAVYGATKAFVLFLSQGLQQELGPKGIYVQAVLPAATRTEIWERSGKDVNTLPAVMEVDDLVDAALAGFDAGELVTIPSLPNGEQWTTFQAARQAMLTEFNQARPAARYLDRMRSGMAVAEAVA